MPTKARSLRETLIATGQPPVDFRPSASARGYGAAWRAMRSRYLTVTPLCEICKAQGKTTAAALVDHIRPISAGGRDLDWGNLRALCVPCHGAITANFKATGVNEMPAGGKN